MQQFLLAAVLCVSASSFGCSRTADNAQKSQENTAATPVPNASVPKNGEYPGKGKITKFNVDGGSVELDHEEIGGVMPAMRMEFFVIDGRLLKGLRVGDDVSFTLRYKDGQEIITEITKQK